jgi:predicted outer membrane repeat protein
MAFRGSPALRPAIKRAVSSGRRAARWGAAGSAPAALAGAGPAGAAALSPSGAAHVRPVLPAAAAIPVGCTVTDLRHAITSAPRNAILVLHSGCVYRLTSALPRITRKNLTIQGSHDTITRTSGSFRMLTVATADLTINQLTMSHARLMNGLGGAIEAREAANVTITNSRFSDDDSTAGAAIDVFNFSRLTVSDSTFARNHATGGGGAVYTRTLLNLTGDSMSGNRADGSGGALEVGAVGNATLSATHISGNTAGADGGGVTNHGTASLTNGSLVTLNRPDNCSGLTC